MTTNLGIQEVEYDVTIFGHTYRVSSITRSKAVTEVLNRYIKDFPDVNMPLSILRTKAKTRVVDEEQELVQAHLDKLDTEE